MKTDSPGILTTHDAADKAALRMIIKLNAHVLGTTLGILFGFGLFAATLILVLKGGPNVGEHLQLLRNYFYGYKVTLAGSFIGGAYGFLSGYVAGCIIALIYNWVDYLRAKSPDQP